jgi:DNA-binding NarL/FixJ family response regulator
MGTVSMSAFRAERRMRRFLMVGDHDVIVAGLRPALPESDLLENCQLISVSSLAEALNALGVDSFDLVLLKLCSSAGGDSLLPLKLLRQRFPAVPVVLFSEDDSPILIRDALRAGASGFIPGPAGAANTVAILEFILKGGIYLPPQVMRLLDHEPIYGAMPPVHISGRLLAGRVLTRRQQSVLDLLLEGHSNKEIARVLGLTLGTIKNYVSELLRTTNARTRSQVLAMVRMQPEAGHAEIENHQVHA